MCCVHHHPLILETVEQEWPWVNLVLESTFCKNYCHGQETHLGGEAHHSADQEDLLLLVSNYTGKPNGAQGSNKKVKLPFTLSIVQVIVL